MGAMSAALILSGKISNFGNNFQLAAITHLSSESKPESNGLKGRQIDLVFRLELGEKRWQAI
jgi:hypothetical protein